MTNLFLSTVIASVLIAGMAFSLHLSAQLQIVHAQDNATTISGNTTGNMTGGNLTSASDHSSVTISPGSFSPNNGKNFVPNTLTVSKGTVVTWTNDDSTEHTVTSGSSPGGNSGAEFDSSPITPGKTFQHTFSTSGTFDYHCNIHPFMKGKVVVS